MVELFTYKIHKWNNKAFISIQNHVKSKDVFAKPVSTN